MSDVDEQFHGLWLGMVQPIEGLVVSVPVLTNAQCYERHPPSLQHTFTNLCAHDAAGDFVTPARVADLPTFLDQLLKLSPDLWDAATTYHSELAWSAHLPNALNYYDAEGGQTIAPTLALKKNDAPLTAAGSTEAVDVAKRYELLLWQLPLGLELDKTETTTGPWHYPPSAKFERLLREVRVPIGLLVNGVIVRLIYAPAGESTGHIDFRLDDMATVGGRPILDAFVMLLHAQRFFAVAAEHTLPALLAESRKYQANVTVELGKQVLQALTLLLRGFEGAAERDGQAMLEAALARDNDHLYQGLLSVLLRMVFVLYAEDRALLPIEDKLYERHYSLFSLFAQLRADHGAFPDSMSRRYGAWGRIVALFRALFGGVSAGELQMPARRGNLFDPSAFAFLEGWDPAGSAPVGSPRAQSEVKLPTIDDETLYEVLHKLILLNAQRLSYRALDVEQIGSVYEGLMGYHVKRVKADAVCMRPNGVWVGADELLEIAPAQREAWLADNVGLVKAQAKALAEAAHGIRSDTKVIDLLEGYALGRTKEARSTARARAGQLVLQPGPERRRTSSHYTPRSLSTQVVERALQPLLATMTPRSAPGPESQSILQLRVCDPAMGSGAFLVEACRYLGDALEAAWRREGTLDKHRDPTLAARRRVAQCCLYGVDKNPVAVELAKLSLWLVTLERHRPFTFMDSNLRHGDSLVGLSLEQVRAFHWRPSPQLELDAQAIGKELEESITARQRLQQLALDENGVNPDTREKELVLDDASDALARLQLMADVCLGAFFAADSDKEREQERLRRLGLVRKWLGEVDAERRATLEAPLRKLQAELRNKQVAFHWMLEFPDVFWADRADPLEEETKNGAAFMDSFVGNPPFMGGPNISVTLGTSYVDWLKAAFDGDRGNRGQCDLSAFFFRLASDLLGKHGSIGLIATNTIGQGDTRAIGLKHLVDRGLTIYDVVPDEPWPGNASVTVSIVHLAKALLDDALQPRFAGVRCDYINSTLDVGSERKDAIQLESNSKASFLGVKTYGQGFLLLAGQRAELIKRDRRNAGKIIPYLGGEEVNTSPTQHFERYVINFGDSSLDKAHDWPDLLDIVKEKVKPERERLPPKNSVNRDRAARWWQFAGRSPELFNAIRPLERCLVTSRVTKHLILSFQPTDRIFSEALYVFPLDHYTAFATLQSRIHEPWARLLSSSMKTDLRYAASDCFETFPFPQPDPRTKLSALEQTGKALYEARAEYMVKADIGLTKTYNALKDPANRDREILKLRELHEAMDRSVLDAYGWTDLKVPPFCPKDTTEQVELKRFGAEVIDRLYALNGTRAADEARLGDTKQPSKGTRMPSRAKSTSDRPSLKPPTKTRESDRTKPAAPSRKRTASSR